MGSIDKIKIWIKSTILKIKSRKLLFSYNSTIICKNSKFEGRNLISYGTKFGGFLGYGSYIGMNSNLDRIKVGRYSAIAMNVSLLIGAHPMTYPFVSISPGFYSKSRIKRKGSVDKNYFKEFRYADENENYNVIIGNDCWIAAHVKIVSGVKINDGAIVLSGAVVTKDVPAYAIVGGIPAKIIKYRFSQEDISFLMETKWWNINPDIIYKHTELFRDFDAFKSNINKIKQ